MAEEDPTTEELLLQQAQRADAEAEAAEEADLPEEEKTHERRADKAAYLREKLEQQQQADAERDE